VQIPVEAYSANLTDFQFRLLAVLCHLAGHRSHVQTSAADLGTQTGNVHEKTVRRGLKALEDFGFIKRTATKKAGGMRGIDRVDICVQSHWDANVRTTGDYVTNSYNSQIVDKPLVPNSQSSYKLKDSESKIQLKEIKVPMRKYEDDGDDLAGFGLVEPKDAPQPKIRRSDPRTRGRRPEHEWTAMDVAAEFSYQVGRKYPLLPGTVNVKALSGALAKFRKQYDTTALIELELLRLFMADESNFRNIGDEAPFLYKMFLSSFGKKMNQARDNLGLAKVTAKLDTTPTSVRLVASDGRTFQNSLSGRAQLERHEKRLSDK
jgi:Fe2+ or Zn2+ uptake regulation protein